MFSPTDTIVAIATAPMRAGIGVVRISGSRAHAIAREILTVPHELEPRYATLTHVRAVPASPEPDSAPSGEGGRPERRGAGGVSRVAVPLRGTRSQLTPDRSPREKRHRHGPPRAPLALREPDGRRVEGSPGSSDPGSIDEVVATYFPAPHSYTAEDVVEISAHGSLALLGEIVRAVTCAGARLAEPGEFTLRAFLNGRLDLVQAEAVADLVDAVTPLQARVAFDQLEGTLTRAIGALDEELFDLAARLEASIDFPDEGYHFVEPGEAASALGRVRDGIDRLLATSASGRVIREGRHIAILGKPNVGKSSLFNQLVGTDRAIVAAIPGTTRDMLRETIDLDGIRLGLVDTAGIRASEDEVEQEGVARARGAAGVADLVILMLDRSRPLEESDWDLLRETAASPRIVVVNKIDLPAAWAADDAGVGARDSLRLARHLARSGQAGFGARKEQKTLDGAESGRGACGEPCEQADLRCTTNAPEGPRTSWGDGAALVPAPRSGAPRAADGTLEARLSGAPSGSRHLPPPRTEGQRERDETLWSGAALSSSKGRVPNPGHCALLVSLRTGDGLDDLRAAMRAALDVAEPLRDTPTVTNVRHETLLRQARESIARAIENLQQAGPATALGAGESASEELVLADIAEGRRALEEVTGRRTSEDLLRRIFERFCVGK